MRDDPDPQLDLLLEDVLATEPVDPELVLRHQRDPGTLTDLERAEVEAWLATPAGRDALGAMRELQRSGAARAAVPQAPVQTARTRVAPPPTRIRGRTAWVWRQALAISLTAAALAVVWVWWQRDPGVDPSGVQVARETPAVPVSPSPAPQREPEPPVAPPEPSAPEAPVEPPSAGAGEAPAREEPRAVPEPSTPPKPEPILLALAMPQYARPGGESFGHLDAELRGTGVETRPFALSPDHVGRTSRSTPLLYWYLAQLPEPGTQIWLAIVDESRAESLLEIELPMPERPGLQPFDLTGRADLLPAITYTWSISLRIDPEHPDRDALALGWIRHDPPSSAERERLGQAETGQRPAAFAALGYFYDALTELEQLARAHATDPQVQRARAALLRQAGIDPARVGLE